jgi:hypothetical protein
VKIRRDAEISPTTASWLREALGVDATAVRDLGLIAAKDRDIFDAARAAGAAVIGYQLVGQGRVSAIQAGMLEDEVADPLFVYVNPRRDRPRPE